MLQGQEINILNRLNIAQKLVLFLVLPVAFLLYFSYLSIIDKKASEKNAADILHSSEIVQKVTNVIYHLQKERGLSVGFVSSEGQIYAVKLTEQRLKTDSEIEQLLPSLSAAPQYLKHQHKDNFSHLRQVGHQLTGFRLHVDHLSSDEFERYSQLIANFLSTVSNLQNMLPDKDLGSSYLNTLWLEEYSGRERAWVNKIFSTKEFNSSIYGLVLNNISNQQGILRAFFNTAAPQYQAQMTSVLENASAMEFEQYRTSLLKRSEKSDTLASLQMLIGYGGIIHNFKNYLLRGGDDYIPLIQQQVAEAIRLINKYKRIDGVSNDENTSLNTIKTTLLKYQSNVALITSMKAEQSPITVIDRIVRIDDQPAFDAVKQLQMNIISHDPESWWQHASQRLDNIHQISSLIIHNLVLDSQKQLSEAQQTLYFYSVGTVLTLLISIFLGLAIKARVINEIKAIATTMRDSQTSGQFNQTLTVSGSDEIAEMAAAFNNLILERAKADNELNLFSRIFEATHGGIIITDSDMNITDVNPAFCEITGYSRDEILGQNPRILSSGKQNSTFYQSMWKKINEQGHFQGEVWNCTKEGKLYAELLTISVLKNDKGEVVNYVGVFTDITHSKHQQEQLTQMANYDRLTGLPNRALFADRFTQAIVHSDRSGHQLAVCFVDLDNFKPVNDNYGHETGDKLLIEVAERITANIRREDTVSRQGGDEFALLLNDIEFYSQCEQTLQRVNHALSQPFLIDGTRHNVTASIGVTLYPQDNGDIDTLLRHADQAMYQAKLEGKHRHHLFNPERDKQTIQKHHQLEEIRQALANNEFQLYYQPKLNMNTGEVYGAEALIRWFHPEKGLIPPLEFLPVIEGTELEIKVGDWVINQALSQLEIWQQLDIYPEVSVNVSSHHLLSEGFFEQVNSALKNHPSVSSEYLQLELVESSALGDLSVINATFSACQNILGIKVALDDFGTGYSSLSHLRSIPADTIKIDQSFVRDMLDDPSDYAIIDGIIGMSNSFAREVIAEGVETTDHGLMLLLMGCEEAQGYGIAKPMPADEFPQWLTNYTPNLTWQNYGYELSARKRKVKLFQLMAYHWKDSFINNIQLEPDSIKHWPIMESNDSSCGTWIKQGRQELLFETKWLTTLKQAHKTVHLVARDILQQYQEGDIELARQHLPKLHLAFEDLEATLVFDE